MGYHNTEKAVFVGIIRPQDNERTVMEYLDELAFLAETAGASGDRKFVQRVDKPDNATYIRSGKLEEIAAYCEENQINYVIFDDELSPRQLRNIEKAFNRPAENHIPGPDRLPLPRGPSVHTGKIHFGGSVRACR